MAAILSNEFGKIMLSEDLIANIAGSAACENYGIVAMSSKSAGDALLQLIGSESLKRGVRITLTEDDKVDIDLYVTLMYGVSFPAVAKNAISNVKYRVEEMTGLTVNKVNIFVEAVRV